MFSKTAEYALRAAVYLATYEGGLATAQTIAEATGVPDRYMAKVLNALVRAGVISSQRGPSGGFALIGAPSEITLLDIVSAVDPVRRIDECPLRLSSHSPRLCPLHQRLDEIGCMVSDALDETTLDDLLAEGVTPLVEGTSLVRINQEGIRASPFCQRDPAKTIGNGG